ERVVLHLADESGARPETREACRRIRSRSSGNLHGRAHGLIDRFRAWLVDQRHRAFLHLVRDEKIVVGARDYVDNGVADSKNIDAGIGHELLSADAERTIASDKLRAIRRRT